MKTNVEHIVSITGANLSKMHLTTIAILTYSNIKGKGQSKPPKCFCMFPIRSIYSNRTISALGHVLSKIDIY